MHKQKNKVAILPICNLEYLHYVYFGATLFLGTPTYHIRNHYNAGTL